MEPHPGSVEAHPGAVKAYPRAVDTHPGAMKAHHGDVEAHTDKKENQIFLIFKEIQNGAVVKSYVRRAS